VPAFDSGDDFSGSAVHVKGFWGEVCLGEEAVDGDLKIDNGSEDAALQAPFG